MKINLESTDIEKVKALLDTIPDGIFGSIPMKFYCLDDITSASVELMDINESIIVSSKIDTEDFKMDEETATVFRLKYDKSMFKNIFGNFDKVEFFKSNITGKTDKRKVKIALMRIDPEDVEDFPTDPDALIEMLEEVNSEDNSEFKILKTKYQIDIDELKEILSCIDMLDSKVKEFDFEFNSDKNELKMKSEDFIGNQFEYKIEVDESDKENFDVKYNAQDFSKILKSVIKNKPEFVDLIITSEIIIFHYETDHGEVLYAITSLKD